MMKAALKGIIKAYAYLISPLTGAKCRFYPTCSAYAAEAIDVHGAAKGSVLAAKRLLKCHPWHRGAMIDPVPASIDWRGIIGYKRGHCGAECTCSSNTTDEKDENHAKP